MLDEEGEHGGGYGFMARENGEVERAGAVDEGGVSNIEHSDINCGLRWGNSEVSEGCMSRAGQEKERKRGE